MLLPAGDADAASVGRIVYTVVTTGLEFPRLSCAKNLSVVVDETGTVTGLGPLALVKVGVVPSVV